MAEPDHAKWSTHASPEHDATLPVTRLVLGSRDYTPGDLAWRPVADRADGPLAHISVTSAPVTAATTTTIRMAPGGGFAARIHP